LPPPIDVRLRGNSRGCHRRGRRQRKPYPQHLLDAVIAFQDEDAIFTHQVRRKKALSRLVQVVCLFFIKGPRITLSTGAIHPKEDLSHDNQIVMRGLSVQKIGLIGQSALSATDKYVTEVIKGGALNNTHDLVLSSENRLFANQRSDQLQPEGPKAPMTRKTALLLRKAWSRKYARDAKNRNKV
jgi:hypothetical protein